MATAKKPKNHDYRHYTIIRYSKVCDYFRFQKNYHLILLEWRIGFLLSLYNKITFFSLAKIDDREEIKMLFPQREECKSPSFQDLGDSAVKLKFNSSKFLSDNVTPSCSGETC